MSIERCNEVIEYMHASFIYVCMYRIYMCVCDQYVLKKKLSKLHVFVC
jgi:hypothetical protein